MDHDSAFGSAPPDETFTGEEGRSAATADGVFDGGDPAGLTARLSQRKPPRETAALADPNLARLLAYLADGLDRGRLADDLGESGFGPFSEGEAKRLHDLFAAAVASTQGTTAAAHPWIELRRLAARLARDGNPAASLEIAGGVGKQAGRHAEAVAFMGAIADDRLAWEAQLAGLSAAVYRDGEAREEVPEGRAAGIPRWAMGAGAAGLAVLAGLVIWTFDGGSPPAQLATATLADTPAPPAAAPVPRAAPAVAAAAAPDPVPLPRRRPRLASQAASITPPPPPEFPPQAATAASAGVDPTPVAALPPAAAPALDFNDPLAVAQVQQRLADLGYFERRPDGMWGPRSRQALDRFRAGAGLPGSGDPDGATMAALFAERAPTAVRPLVASLGGTDAAAAPAAPAVAELPAAAAPRLDPSNQDDAQEIQQRLFALGFYSGVTDGAWGAVSRQALRDFKVVNHLPDDDVWDAATEARLTSAAANGAAGTMIGVWAPHPSLCPSPLDPGAQAMTITTASISGGGRFCALDQVRRAGTDWSAVGDCNGERTVFRYTLDGDRLIDIAGGGATYGRCAAIDTASVAAASPAQRAIVPFPPPPPPGNAGGGLQPLIDYGFGMIRR